MAHLSNGELAAWSGVFLTVAIPVTGALYARLKDRIQKDGMVADHEKRISRVENHIWPGSADD